MSAKERAKDNDQDRRSLKSHLGSEVKMENNTKFDEGRIIDHYVKLKQSQQQKLANINLSEQLKRKLFGFSQGYYLTNLHDPSRLIIQNHPIKGRTIMSEERYHFQLHNRYREKQFRTQKTFSVSRQRDLSNSRLYIDSDIQVPFPSESDKFQLNHNNPEFNFPSQQPLKSQKQPTL